MIKLILAVALTFSQTSWACDGVTEVKKGETVQCDGLLFPPSEAKKVDEALEDLEYYKLLNIKLEQRIEYSNTQTELLEKRVQLYLEQSTAMASELSRRDSTDKWEKVIYFGLGVLATGIAVHGAAQLR